MLICHCLYGLKGREREREKKKTNQGPWFSVWAGVFGNSVDTFCVILLYKGSPIFHQTQTSTWSVLVATSWTPKWVAHFPQWRYAMLMEDIQRTSSLGSFFHHFFPSVMFDMFGYNTCEEYSMLEEANPCISTGSTQMFVHCAPDSNP